MRSPVRKAAAALVLVTGAVLVACDAAGTEPVGLATDGVVTNSPVPDDVPTSTTEPTPTTRPDDDGPDDDGTDDPEPRASFTQPYVPGEPRVIDLPDQLPVDPPDGVSDAELEVLDAVGRFMASWQAVLFGADEERSGIGLTSTGVQLGRLRDFVRDAAEEEWVFTGDPMRLGARSVGVEGDVAEVDLCIELPQWFEVRGSRIDPYNSLERYAIEMERVDGQWLAADTQKTEADVCDG